MWDSRSVGRVGWGGVGSGPSVRPSPPQPSSACHLFCQPVRPASWVFELLLAPTSPFAKSLSCPPTSFGLIKTISCLILCLLLLHLGSYSPHVILVWTDRAVPSCCPSHCLDHYLSRCAQNRIWCDRAISMQLCKCSADAFDVNWGNWVKTVMDFGSSHGPYKIMYFGSSSRGHSSSRGQQPGVWHMDVKQTMMVL